MKTINICTVLNTTTGKVLFTHDFVFISIGVVRVVTVSICRIWFNSDNLYFRLFLILYFDGQTVHFFFFAFDFIMNHPHPL